MANIFFLWFIMRVYFFKGKVFENILRYLVENQLGGKVFLIHAHLTEITTYLKVSSRASTYEPSKKTLLNVNKHLVR